MTGAYADLKPLAISCLDDNPKNCPSVTEVLTKIKQLKKTGEKRELYFDIWTDGNEQLLSQSQEQNQQQCQALQCQKELQQSQQEEQQNHQSERDQRQQEQTQQHEQTMKQEHQQKSIQVCS